jgi:hypothetical protein
MLFSAFSLSAKNGSELSDQHALNFHQKEQSTPLNNLQQLSEKEESETEFDIDVEQFAFVIPFVNAQISYITFTSAHLAERESLDLSTPAVYILCSTFRI